MLMKDRVCVVTGAASSQGIGRATADMLAANGAHVVVLDVSENVDDATREIAGDHPSSSILGVKCNIAIASACEEAVVRVTRAFNRVDALIHCAGIIRSGRYDEISAKDFDEVIAVNLTGAFNIIRSFALQWSRKARAQSSTSPQSQRNAAAASSAARTMRRQRAAYSV
jgi:NAD(P)-dependent dehydrogenase (short-subunit alcohol dehydrogenase family)